MELLLTRSKSLTIITLIKTSTYLAVKLIGRVIEKNKNLMNVSLSRLKTLTIRALIKISTYLAVKIIWRVLRIANRIPRGGQHIEARTAYFNAGPIEFHVKGGSESWREFCHMSTNRDKLRTTKLLYKIYGSDVCNQILRKCFLPQKNILKKFSEWKLKNWRNFSYNI